MTDKEIVIYFPRGIEPLKIPTNVEPDLLTVEVATKKCIDYVQDLVCAKRADGNGPVCFPAFGLATSPGCNLYLPLWHTFERTSLKSREYLFRVRHHLITFDTRSSNVMIEYLFLQILDDFLRGDLSKFQEIEESKLFFLVSIALLMPKSLPFDGDTKVDHKFESCDLTYFNLTQLFSKDIVKGLHAKNFCDRFWAIQALQKKRKEYIAQNFPLQHIKQQLYKKLIEYRPSYGFEEQYEATVIGPDQKEETVTVILGQYDSQSGLPVLYYGEERQCFINDIEDIKLYKPRNLSKKLWNVLIHMKEGPPKSINFNEERAAESFISQIQGYYKLCVKYDTYLNWDLQTESAKISRELRSFGPLGKDSAEGFLYNFTEGSNGSAFLIHESAKLYNCYGVVALNAGDRASNFKPKEMEITVSGKQFVLDIKGEPEEKVRFGSCDDLRRHLKKNAQQVLPSQYSKVADINYFFMRDEIDPYERYYQVAQPEKSSDASIILPSDLFGETPIPDKHNPSVEKYKAVWRSCEGCEEEVMVVKLKSEDLNKTDFRKASAFREGVQKLLTLNRAKVGQFVKVKGMLMESEIGFVMEYTPHTDLLTFICQKPQTVAQKMNIAYQIVKILEVMEEKKLFHGNIRLRKFMVFETPDQRQIKLGDGGISSHFDKFSFELEENVERYPWLSPERCRQLSQITYQSECFAVGTTLCELLYRNDQFHEELKMKNSKELKQYLEKNTYLPPPPCIKESEEGGQAAEGDPEEDDALAPKAVEVLKGLWDSVIMKCWSEEGERPPTEELIYIIHGLCEKADLLKGDTNLEELKQVAYDLGIIKSTNPQLTLNQLQAKMAKECSYLPETCIRMKKRLGQGHFGAVWSGEIRSPRRHIEEGSSKVKQTLEAPSSEEWNEVAIKRLLNGINDERTFLKEILLASQLKHPNICQVLYFSNDKKFNDGNYLPYMLIMEYMNLDTLSKYAKDHQALTEAKDTNHIEQLLKICLDVARGMVYLSGKEIVHRDLAARNILLSKQRNGGIIAKVADFGLAREMDERARFYLLNTTQSFPVCWWPPECIQESDRCEFTTKGDVWAFGISMWEGFNKGKDIRRVINLPKDNSGLHLYEQYTKRNWRLPKEPYVDDAVYNIMKRCWELEPSKRPAFVDLEQDLLYLLQPDQGVIA